MVELGFVCLVFSKKLPLKLEALILTVMLISLITRPINYSSALLVAVEQSIAIDMVLPFSTPLQNNNKAAAVALKRKAEPPT